MTHLLKFALINFISFVCAFSTLANQNKAPNNDIETFTITGTYLPEHSQNSRFEKVTINAKQIAALATNSIADVLRGQPGIDIVEQGGIGGLTFLSIRGGDPNFTVIIIDGVKVNDPTNSRGGAFDLGTIDPAMIEKIDIFYGGFSTVLGSDALAGVVNITTKRMAQDKRAQLSVKAGNDDVLGANLHVGVALDDLARLSINGAFQEGDNSSFSDAFKRNEISTTLSAMQNSKHQWQIGAFYSDAQAQSFPEDSGGDRLAVIRIPEQRDFSQTNLSALYKNQISASFGVHFNSAWSEREEESIHPGIASGKLDGVPAIDSKTQYQRLDLNATANYIFSEKVSSALGLALSDEDGAMDSFIDFGMPVPAAYTLKRKTESVFAELGFDPSTRLSITTGIRFDHNEQSNITTKRLLARYQFSDATIISMHYSEGFKLPSFFALAHPFVGNPELKPERSKNYSVSIETHFLANQLQLTSSLYDNTFSDLVDFDPIAFTNINRAKVSAQGAELSLNYLANEQLNFSGQVSYNDINTFEENTVLRRRPKYKANVQMNFNPVQSVALTARASYNDDYFDSSIPTAMITIKAYTQIDLSARWQITSDSNFRINFANVLDSDTEQSVGFSNTGRHFIARISTQF